MDTGTDGYNNILKALGKPQQSSGLTIQQQSDNYNAFSELMKQGVYLPDLMKRMEGMEAKIKEMDERRSAEDMDLFAVMESAVKDAPEVKEARQRVADEKSRVIARMCMDDPGYRDAVESYRRVVNQTYVKRKEGGETRIRAE